MRVSLTAVYESVEDGWTQARIEELPAVITAGPTLDDARELLLDALREYLLSLGDDGSRSVSSAIGTAPYTESLEIVLGA